MPMATRSPGCDAVAVDEQGGERVDVPHHLGEGPALVLVDEEDLVARARAVPNTSRRLGGACLNTLVGTPSTSITSISNRSPGAVTAAAASS